MSHRPVQTCTYVQPAPHNSSARRERYHRPAPTTLPAPPLTRCPQVVLPDGASNPVVRSQLPLAGEPEISHTYTYLDVVGRPVVVLRARNLVQELSLPFAVRRAARAVEAW